MAIPNIDTSTLQAAETADQIEGLRLTDGGRPVGSVEEIEAIGLDPRGYVVCASRKVDGQPTCAFWKQCQFPFKGRALSQGLPGPQFVGVDKRLPNGQSNGIVTECWRYYESGLATERQSSPKTNVMVQVTAREGGTVSQKFSTREHQTPKKDCEGCLKGSCTKVKRGRHDVTVPAHPRPKDTLRFAMDDLAIQERIRRSIDLGDSMAMVGDPLPLEIPPDPPRGTNAEAEPGKPRRA